MGATRFWRVRFAETDYAHLLNQPLRDIAASDSPFRCNGVPAAKASVGNLRTRINALLVAERRIATGVLDGHEKKIKELEEFSKLDEAARNRVIGKTASAGALGHRHPRRLEPLSHTRHRSPSWLNWQVLHHHRAKTGDPAQGASD